MKSDKDADQMRRPLNWLPIYPDEDAGPVDRIDGYNAYLLESIQLASRRLKRRVQSLWSLEKTESKNAVE